MDRQYYVYIMTNPTRTVLYTGVRNDLRKRVFQHREKLVPGFTGKIQRQQTRFLRSDSGCEKRHRTRETIEAPCSKLQEIFDLQGSTIYSNRSLTPQQATGNALAPGFKGGSRAKKEALINAMNPVWKDLYDTL